MKNFFTTCIICLLILSAKAQSITQTVKGRVVEKESKAPMSGVVVVLVPAGNSPSNLGTQTDDNGYFKLNNVPVGKQSFLFKYLGYQNVSLENIIVNSGKEVILNVEMEENVSKIAEVEIKANPKGNVRNELATVSARTFDIAETERYAGSRQDPARMASNFAGAQGTNDTRNDIVIRGNSPLGVVWRMDDATIPNPNHFAIAGTTGGPASILNNKSIANSDFLTGAFPAEYGNGIAAVFDLKMRNGNQEKYEGTFQLGLLGTEAALEGPISKKHRSSFLATYRYSTLQLFQGMNVTLGTEAIPNYQDFSFRFNFPIKNKSNLAIWGIGGSSHINIIYSDVFNIRAHDSVNNVRTEKYGMNDRDQLFSSGMYTMAASFNHTFSNNTYFKAVLSQSQQRNSATHILTLRDNNTSKIMDVQSLGYRFITHITGLNAYVNHKFSPHLTLKAGSSIEMFSYDFLDSSINEIKLKSSVYPVLPNGFYNLSGPFNLVTPVKEYNRKYDSRETVILLQPYAQMKYRFSDRFFITGGLHIQYSSVNRDLTVEPRAGASCKTGTKGNLSFGAGLHSQTLPSYMYFYRLPSAPDALLFKNVKNMRSAQFVAAYDYAVSSHMRIKTEVYYQYLYKVPVQVIPSSFSMINQGSGFARIYPDTTLKNAGTGTNYGIEFTLERFYYHNYYFMTTVSLYNSTYTGSNGKTYNSDFNGNYAANLLGGYELKLKQGKKGNDQTLIFGVKFTVGGGKRYSPADTLKTIQRAEYTALDAERNALQFRPYSRVDIKLGYKINTRKLTHEIALDLVNAFNIKNFLALTYGIDPVTNGLNLGTETQLGLLPIFYYKLDFGFSKK